MIVTVLIVAAVVAAIIAVSVQWEKRHPVEVWPGADDAARRREATGRASTRARYAIAEAAQYLPWGAGTSVVSVEDFLPPPSGCQLLIVTPSTERARHAIRRGGLNPDNVKIIRYPWQVPPPIDAGPALRVAILADAYQLEHWAELQGEFARRRGAQFLLLQT